MTAPIAFGERHVLPIVLGFLREQPEIDMRLTLTDRQISLADEPVDVALRIGHLADSALIATRVGSVRRVVCASPDYIARRGVPLDPDDLARHDGISFQGFATAPEVRYRRDGTTFNVEPRPRLAVNTTEAAIQAAMSGIGIIRVLSYQVADQLRSGALQEILTEFAPEPLPVNVIHGPAEPLSMKVRCFLDWLTPACANGWLNEFRSGPTADLLHFCSRPSARLPASCRRRRPSGQFISIGIAKICDERAVRTRRRRALDCRAAMRDAGGMPG